MLLFMKLIEEKLARYGSSSLTGLEHPALPVGKESVALALIRHFGSLKGLARVRRENSEIIYEA